MVTRHIKTVLIKALRIAAGVLFILLGIVSGFIPILQGWIFILIGLFILSYDIPFVHRRLEELRKRFPHHEKRMHRFRDWWHRKWEAVQGLFRRRTPVRQEVVSRNPGCERDAMPGGKTGTTND